MKKIWILLGISVYFFCSSAEAQMLIEQGKIKETVTPGGTVIGAITVHNSSKDPLDVIVYLEDFKYVAPFDGAKEFFSAGALDRSAASWITFQPKKLTLPPFGRAKVSYTARVPQAVQGGYYSVLFFEKSDRQLLSHGKAGISVITRVGSLLFFETKDAKKAIDLTEIVIENGQCRARMTNIGDTALVAGCMFYVLNEQGVPVDRGSLDKLYIWTDSQVELQIPFPEDLPAGTYTMVLTFDLENSVSSVHEIDFAKKSSGQVELLEYRK